MTNYSGQFMLKFNDDSEVDSDSESSKKLKLVKNCKESKSNDDNIVDWSK